MTELNENRGRAGGSIKSLWTANEAKLVKRFLNTFQIRQWDFPYTYVDRSDPEGEWILNVPRATTGKAVAGLWDGGASATGPVTGFVVSEENNTNVLDATAHPGNKIVVKKTGHYLVVVNANVWTSRSHTSGSTKETLDHFGWVNLYVNANPQQPPVGHRHSIDSDVPYAVSMHISGGCQTFSLLLQADDELTAVADVNAGYALITQVRLEAMEI